MVRRDIAAQDTVAQQAQAAQVGEAWPLGQPGHHGQMKRGAQARDRKVHPDAPVQLGISQRFGELTAGSFAEQALEPAGLEAGRDD